MCEDAGACMITVHGRTRDMIYAGEPDYDQIAAAKRAVRIPVIANGGVWNRADMDKMLERTGADGVMIARAALYRPQIFCDIPGREAPSMRTVFFEQFERTLSLYGPRFAVVFMRKMAAFYCKGLRGATEYRRRLFAVTTPEALRALAAEIFQEE